MSSDVVPVDVGGGGRHGLVCQFDNFIINIADSKARIDQETSILSVQEVAVGFLPVAVFAENIGSAVDFVNGEPIAHKRMPFFSAALRAAFALIFIQIRPAGRGPSFRLCEKKQKHPQGGFASLENPLMCRFVTLRPDGLPSCPVPWAVSGRSVGACALPRELYDDRCGGRAPLLPFFPVR